MLSDVLGVLLETGKHSDLTLVCEGREFHVHKAVLCLQSPVFEKACAGSWREASEQVIRIRAFDADTVDHMVKFLYSGKYEGGSTDFLGNISIEAASVNLEPLVGPKYDFSEWLGNEDDDAVCYFDTLKPHICMNAIGDYYIIPELREQAKDAVQYLLEGDTWSRKGFLAAAKYAFETTCDNELRGVMIRTAIDHFQELIQMDEFTKLESHPAFAAMIIQQLGTKLDRFQCEVSELRLTQSNLSFTLHESWDALYALNESIKDCIHRLRDLPQCRHCNDPINIYIHEGPINRVTQQCAYIIRCRGCSTKQ